MPLKRLKQPPPSNLFTDPRCCFFVDPFGYLYVIFVFVRPHVALRSPAGKGLISRLSRVLCFVTSYMVSRVRCGT